MIPKIIHYCWFGGNKLPELALKCVASWREYFPNYEIKEWNESNYDVHKISYISEAYNAKKYAFVSDYARFDILYQYGGIYFDVDVEVIKPFGCILNDTGFMGMETSAGCNAGLGVGVAAGLGVVLEILESYTNEHFLRHDGIHEYNLKTIVERVTEIFVKKGFDTKSNEIQRIADITIYSPEYFAPKSYETGIISITKNTVSIHHYNASWVPYEKVRVHDRRRRIFSIFGDNILSKCLVFCDLFFVMTMNLFIRFFIKPGPVSAFKYYYVKLFGKRK